MLEPSTRFRSRARHAVAAVTIAGSLLAAFELLAEPSPNYSPTTVTDFPRNVYWGDLHVHSRLSPDSYSFGNSRLTGDDAYNFAKGQLIVAQNGIKARLRRPLDFLMVSDHAEFLGVFPKLDDRDQDLLATSLGKRWDGYRQAGGNAQVMGEFVQFIQDPDYVQELPEQFRRGVWQEVAAVADRHNDPGRFTAFIGYEWTSMVEGNNLHRVVVFRDGASVAGRWVPFSSLDSQDPEDLWAALAGYEANTGGRVLAIPHNGNVSNGLMFDDETLSGQPYTRAYAEARDRWEPLYEVTQVKGDGEAHPFLSPDDEFADYETWDADNIGRTVPKDNAMLQHEYARSALKLGLQFDAALGANPYRFGMIGSTDSHTTLATADDDNFFGKFRDSLPGSDRMTNQMGQRLWDNWRLAASGYAGVWARENTREALFDAMRNKEVYATTGPRIAVRLFGGWEFDAADQYSPDLAAVGYGKGVPMGGDLVARRDGDGAPSFLLSALKDPDGANLDRAQIVKGWLDGDGELKERVYDIAVSDGRPIDPETGRTQAVGSTVDVANATYANSIGAASLATVWRDPDFDASERAFYYARVIEIPTPRWTAYDVARLKLEDVDPDIPMVTQERVYTSAIWYTP